MVDSANDWPTDESEGLYRSLFDLTPLPTIIHNGRTVLRANRAAAEAFGFDDAESLTGVALAPHVHPDSAATVGARVAAMLRGESVPPLVERYLRSDGSDFEGETFASLTTWHGQPAIHVIIRDLTRMQAAEDELRRSEDSYRQLFELAPDPIIVHDGQTPLHFNRAAWEFLALDQAGDTEKSIWSVVPEDQRALVAARMQEMQKSGKPSTPVKLQLRALNGEPKEAEITSARTWWQGAPAVVTVFRDLTERLRTEAELRKMQARYEAVVEQAPMGMHFFQVDSEGQLIFTGSNKAADRILGVDCSAVLGLPIEQAWPGLAGTDVPETNKRIALEGGIDVRSVPYHDGSVDGVFETHVFPIGDQTCVAMFWDVTQRVHDEQELDQYRHHLEELIAERTRALDQAHHDVEAITLIAARAVELRDPYTAGHQRRVAQLAHRIALEHGLSERDADRIRIAAKLHDIGKLSIPAEILSKPGRLTNIEYELVKGHAAAAYEILHLTDMGWPLAEMVLQHHERMDGSGYPNGLLGKDIMVEARILAVADVVESMSSHRPYRPALGMAEAAEEITQQSGTLYDEDVVAACICVINSGFEFAEDSGGVYG